MKKLIHKSVYFVLIFTLLFSILSVISSSSNSLAKGGYTVIFDANGGNVSPSSKILNSGDVYGELPTPTKEGYKFLGWTLQTYKTLKSESPFYDTYFGRNVLRLAPGDPTTNGLFKIGDKLVFDVQVDGTVPIGVDINDNDLTTAEFSIDGNRIFGEVIINYAHYTKWGSNSYSFLDINCQDPVSTYHVNEFKLYSGSSEEIMITSESIFDAKDEVKLIAKWEEIKNWNVNFETNGADEPIEDILVEDGQKVAQPADPVRKNCTFDGWYSDAELTKAFNFETPITDNITIYAKWTPHYHDATLKLTDGMDISGDLGEGELVFEFLVYKELLIYEEIAEKNIINVYDKNHKLLCTAGEDEILVLAENVSSKDNIEYTTTDEDKAMLGVSGIYINKFKMIFEKTNETDIEPVIEPKPIVYEVIEGANQTYTKNKDTNATFKINAEYSAFQDGGKVYVDDVEVDSSNYTSEAGSTIITFNKEYMDSLEIGQHTLLVAFNDAGLASTNFNIEKEEVKDTPTGNPKTGDAILVWITTFTISILGMAGTVRRFKKIK